MKYENLWFIDTETTGLDPEKHEIWEAAAIRWTGAEDTEWKGTPGHTITVKSGWEEHHWFVVPNRFGDSEPIALDIGHYRERMDLQNCDSQNQFAATFADLTWGGTLIGAIPSFDEERIRRLCRKSNVVHNWHYHLIDIKSLMLGFLQGSVMASRAAGFEAISEWSIEQFPFKHSQLLEPMGIVVSDEDKHTAMGDARAVRDGFVKIFGAPDGAS